MCTESERARSCVNISPLEGIRCQNLQLSQEPFAFIYRYINVLCAQVQ